MIVEQAKSGSGSKSLRIIHLETRFPQGSRLAAFTLFLWLSTGLIANSLWAADCFQTLQITLSSQSDVDNFQANYGQGGVCNTLKSELIVSGNDISNLNGLADITSTNRNVQVQYNPMLTDISGLSGLEMASGLTIRENNNLEQIDGLSGLETVGGLYVITNPKLQSISGLGNLATADFIQIGDNPVLDSLNGLDALEIVHETLQLTSLPGLTHLDDLASLTQVGLLLINENPFLQNIDGLNSLQDAGSVIVRGNAALLDLDGLSNLKATLSSLEIENNPVLADLHGLAGISGDISHTLWIVNNDAIVDLTGLEGLTSAAGFYVSSNEKLENLDALSNLTHVGSIGISQNPELTSIEALGNLQGAVDSLVVRANPKLASINALAGIEGPLQGELDISGNSLIQDVDGLIGITGANSVDIGDNASLANLNGLASMIRVGKPIVSFGGTLIVSGNTNLNNCVGLIPLLDDLDDGEHGPRPDFEVGPPDIESIIIITNNGENCNSSNTITGYSVSANLAVSKAYSNNDDRPVPVSLECELSTVLFTAEQEEAAPGSPAEFSLSRFIPGFNSNCTAFESQVPTGYLADNSGCHDLQLANGANLGCEILNKTVPSSVTIEKLYTHTEPPQFPEVLVTLTCPTGEVKPAQAQKTIGGIAQFEVVNYDYNGETCVATENVRAGYIQVGHEGCESLEVGLGVTSSCSFTNEIDPEVIFPDGFETW